MNLLTLNTHSWLEKEAEQKLQQLVEKIIEADYEVIALQEVNQLVDSLLVSQSELIGFCPVSGQKSIHEDNFAYCLVKKLAMKGRTYYWSWDMSHIGYDIYEEGNALLSKNPLTSEAIVVSETSNYQDYRTRKLLIGNTLFQGKEICVVSTHFSWWQDENSGFAFEWHQLEKRLLTETNPLFLLGDFNNPAQEAGYSLVEKSPLALRDSYSIAKVKSGEATVEQAIDGWKENTRKLRIDYIFVPATSIVDAYQVVFDGKNGPVVSDHFGIEIEITKF